MCDGVKYKNKNEIPAKYFKRFYGGNKIVCPENKIIIQKNNIRNIEM